MHLALIDNLQFYSYYFIFAIALLEGPILGIICGVLIHAGFLSLLPTAIVLMVADVVDDIVWYSVGYHGSKKLLAKLAHSIGVGEGGLEKMTTVFRKHYITILSISKMTTGFGLSGFIVAMAGVSKVPFRKYMIINLIGEPIWTAVLLGIGYYGGVVYQLANETLQWFYLTPIILVLLFVVIALIRHLRQLFLKRILHTDDN